MAKTTRDILIQTDRPDEARDFYAGVLGFSPVHDAPGLRGFETGAFRLYVEPAAPLGPVLEILVENLAETKARLLQAGCRVEAEDASVPKCYMRDPFGLIFNIGQN